MDQIDVLDHGFVRLVSHMGSDSSIAEAARVSVKSNSNVKRSTDRQLLRYMMSNSHSSPFEFAELVFHVKLPIFVARQWMRHRTWSYSEVSGRYSELSSETYTPDDAHVNLQSTSNKQGRGELADGRVAEGFRNGCELTARNAFRYYESNLSDGLAKELCRINLPLSTYTEFYCKVDLNNLFKFLKLRLDSHAQYEIRVYAEAIAKIVEELFPISFEAFKDYQLDVEVLSQGQIKYFRTMCRTFFTDESLLSWLRDQELFGMSKSEQDQVRRILGI